MTCPDCGSSDVRLYGYSTVDRGGGRRFRSPEDVCRDCGAKRTVEPARIPLALLLRDMTRREVQACERASAAYGEIHGIMLGRSRGARGWGAEGYEGETPEEIVREVARDWRHEVRLLQVAVAIHEEGVEV